MDDNIAWLVGGVLAALVIPIVVIGFNERRLRRRHQALATRRKVKQRL